MELALWGEVLATQKWGPEFKSAEPHPTQNKQKPQQQQQHQQARQWANNLSSEKKRQEDPRSLLTANLANPWVSCRVSGRLYLTKIEWPTIGPDALCQPLGSTWTHTGVYTACVHAWCAAHARAFTYTHMPHTIIKQKVEILCSSATIMSLCCSNIPQVESTLLSNMLWVLLQGTYRLLCSRNCLETVSAHHSLSSKDRDSPDHNKFSSGLQAGMGLFVLHWWPPTALQEIAPKLVPHVRIWVQVFHLGDNPMGSNESKREKQGRVEREERGC